MKRTLTIILFIVMFQFSSFGGKYEKLVSDFKTPTEDNHLWCYWYWINDDISKEGISGDLAAMKQAGIGTAFIGNINPQGKDGKVALFSDQWWECMVHAVNEGKRLGVDIGTFNCPGWSQSGGPWVKPEMAMRYLTYSETVVEGPGKVTKKLAKPKEEFQDVYVLAYPAFDGMKTLTKDNTAIKVTPEIKDARNWIDGNLETKARFPGAKQYTIELNAKSPVTARSIAIHPISKNNMSTGPSQPIQCKLYARVNGADKLVRSFVFDRGNQNVNVGPISDGPVVISLPEIAASEFKLVCTGAVNKNNGFTQIAISEKPVLDRYIEKQLGKMYPTPLPMWGSYLWDDQKSLAEGLEVPSKKVLDITGKMDKDGNLNWKAPAGKWTVMRIGMTPTGTKNSPAAPQGKGYEIDKANEELIRFHFKQYVGKLYDKIPAENRDAFKYVIMDSYEMGSQNWTDGFEKRFEKRYGYNPKKWLPVLSGVIVSSVDESNRFLWDLRRAVADDVAYEYVGGLRKISNKYGLKTWLENYGHWGFPGEFLMYGGQSDLVGGEYWNEGTLGNIECKAASSCVHIYGKEKCFAEAFTSGRRAYKRHPEVLKRRGDWSFTEGINQFVLHLYIQQPDDNRVPGMNAWFGTEFNRHNTWFAQSKHWMDYNRRCQHLLQQGSYVADVCYFISENTPKMTGVRSPELPEGYSYDYINAEVIVRDMKVKDGKLVLPSGASYSLMVLPPIDTMRPAVIAKLEELVRQGGAIYGPKPVRSPSMQDYPDCDEQVRTIADKMWGKRCNSRRWDIKYGRYRIFHSSNLGSVLKKLKVGEDLQVPEEFILWTHRTMKDMDIYFLSNQHTGAITFPATFRVAGLKPQIWDPVTGEIRQINKFRQDHISTGLSMVNLEPGQSMFVVFTNQSSEEVHKGYTDDFTRGNILLKVPGPWKVAFDNPVIDVRHEQTFNTLSDWSKNKNDTIKYYSGTAVYSTDFKLDSIPTGKDIFINLGKVGVMAEVTVNGKFAGGTWIAPYVLNVTDLVKPGKNTLKIEVVNLWRNYLVKEKSLPKDQQKTWLTVSDVKKNEPLQPSGLIGPVKLETIDRK